MPPFCQIGKGLSAHPPDDQPSLLADSASLSLFPHRLLYPSSPLNYKPMLAHSRTTTEQRSCMDALELGNDSGSLLACRNRPHSPQARGGLRGRTQHLGLDQQGLEAALDSKEDSRRGRARREIELEDADLQTMLDDERLHQTLLRGLQKMRGDRRQLCRALDTLARFR